MKAIYFDELFLQEIRDRNDIVDVISADVDLKHNGNRFLGLCPFHNEKTPSFQVSADRQLYYCFGCHEGGNVINYIEKSKNLDFVEAVKFLAERAGIPVPEDNTGLPKEYELKQTIYEINRAAARYFYGNLKTSQGKIAYDYLKDRGLTDKTINNYGLGYALNSWDALLKYLLGMGFKEYDIIKAGLAVKKDKGAFDFFRGRVIFPVIDLRGNVIAFGGRVFGDEKPKYLNTGETPAFKKRMNLFSLDKAKNCKEDGIILAEGYMDVISLYQYGFKNAVASLGTAFCEEHAKLLKKHTHTVYVCYDNDTAGQTALKKAADIILAENLEVKVIALKGGKDPDEILKKFGAEYFASLVKNAQPYFQYVLTAGKKEADLNSVEGKAAYAKQAAGELVKISDRVERALYIKKLSEELSISENLLNEEIEKQYLKGRKAAFKKQEQKEAYKRNSLSIEDKFKNEQYTREAELINAIIRNFECFPKIRQMLPQDFFTNDIFKKIYKILEDSDSGSKVCDINFIIDKLDEKERNEFIKILMWDTKFENFSKDYEAILKRIIEIKVKLPKADTSTDEMMKKLEQLKRVAKAKKS